MVSMFLERVTIGIVGPPPKGLSGGFSFVCAEL